MGLLKLGCHAPYCPPYSTFMPAMPKQHSCISCRYSIMVSLLLRASMSTEASPLPMFTMPRLLLVSTTSGMLGM